MPESSLQSPSNEASLDGSAVRLRLLLDREQLYETRTVSSLLSCMGGRAQSAKRSALPVGERDRIRCQISQSVEIYASA